jgi:hypothetical protein
VVKRGRDLAAQHQRQPLNAVKVSVLNGHHTCVYAAVISDVISQQGFV